MTTLPLPGRPRLRRPELPSLTLLRVELLAGLVVALALIPEAISFSVIAGVDPRVGLYASFTMAVASVHGSRSCSVRSGSPSSCASSRGRS